MNEADHILFKIQDPKYGFLSNFYNSRFVDDSGIIWNTNEHYYQAMKTINPVERGEVWTALSAKVAKQAGKGVTLRDDWNDIKQKVMWKGLNYKFRQNPTLRQKLLDTIGHELIEWAPWDEYWGSGKNFNGSNHLGKQLMKLRSDLYNEGYFSYE